MTPTSDPQEPVTAYFDPDRDNAVGGALLETEHIGGFARRAPYFVRELERVGWTVAPVALADARPDAALREALTAAREEMRLRIEAWRTTVFGRIPHHATQRILEPLDSLLAAASPDSAPAGLDALREQVRALQPKKQALAYRQGYDDAILETLALIRARLRATPASTTGPGAEG